MLTTKTRGKRSKKVGPVSYNVPIGWLIAASRSWKFARKVYRQLWNGLLVVLRLSTSQLMISYDVYNCNKYACLCWTVVVLDNDENMFMGDTLNESD